MAAEVHADITVIQDEDVLRRMWADTEDFGRKKEIRAHMYKLREQRLKDFYTGETVASTQQIARKQTTTHRATDSIGDQGFLTMKTKEIRDSESPTRDFSGISGRVVVSGGTELDRNGGYWTSRNESSYSTSNNDGAVINTREQLSDGQGIIRGDGYETQMALSSEGKHETLNKQDENSSLKAESISQSSKMASVTKSDGGESINQSESKKEEKKSEQVSSSTTSSSTTKFSSSSSVSRSSQRVVSSSSTTRYVTESDQFGDVKAITAPSQDFQDETTSQTSNIINKTQSDQRDQTIFRDQTNRDEHVLRDHSIRDQTSFRDQTIRDESILRDQSIRDQTVLDSSVRDETTIKDQSTRNVQTVNSEVDVREKMDSQARDDLVQNREVIETVVDNRDTADTQISRQRMVSSSRADEKTVKTDQSKVHKIDVASSQTIPAPSVPSIPGPVTDSVNWTVVTQDNQDNEFVYTKEPKEPEPQHQIPLREKPVKHPSNLDLPKEATEGQYVTTYQSDYTRPGRISVDHSPSHDYFASTLRASPDRSTPSPTKRGSRGSLDSHGSPERKLRGNSRSRSSLDRSSPERRPDRRGSSGSYTIDRKEKKVETTKDTRRKFSSTQQKQVNKTRVSTPGASPSPSPSRRPVPKESDSDSDNSHATYDATAVTTTTSTLKTERNLLTTREKSPEYSSEGSITRELRRKGQEPSPERSAFTPIKNFRTGPEEGAITVEERKTESRRTGRRETEELQTTDDVDIIQDIETLNVTDKETDSSRKFIEQEVVTNIKTAGKPSCPAPGDRVSPDRSTRKTTPDISPVRQKPVSPKSSPDSSPVRRRPTSNDSPTRKQPTSASSPTRKQPMSGVSPTRKQPVSDISPTRKQPGSPERSPTRKQPTSSPERSPTRKQPTSSPERSPTRKQPTSPERSPTRKQPSSPSRDSPDRSHNRRVTSSPERPTTKGTSQRSPVRKQPSATSLDRTPRKPATDSRSVNRTESLTRTSSTRTATTTSVRDTPKRRPIDASPVKQSNRTITKRTSSKSITDSPVSQVKRSASPVKQVQRQPSGPIKPQQSVSTTRKATTTTSTTRTTQPSQLKKPTTYASTPRTPEKRPQEKVISPKRPSSASTTPTHKAPTQTTPRKSAPTAERKPRIPDTPTKASTVRTSVTGNTRSVPSSITRTTKTTTTRRSVPQSKPTVTRKTEVTKKFIDNEIDTSDLEDEQPPDEFYAELDDTVDASEIRKQTQIRITSHGHTVQSKKKIKRPESPSSSSSDSDNETTPQSHRPQLTTNARLTTASNQDLLNVIVQQPKSSRESSPGYPSAGLPTYTTTSDDGESNPRFADFISEPEDVEIFDTLRGPRGPIEVSKTRDQVQVTDLDEEDVSTLNVADKVSVFLEAAKNSVEPLEPTVSQPVHIESKSVTKAKSLFENISKTQTNVSEVRKPEEPVRRPSVEIKPEETTRRLSGDRKPEEAVRRPSGERKPEETFRRPSQPQIDETQELLEIETRQETVNRVDESRKSVRKDTPVPKPLSSVGSNDERKPFERKISSTNVDVNSKKSLFEKKIREQAEPVTRKPTTERTESTYMKSTVASSVRATSPEKDVIPRRPSHSEDSPRKTSKPGDETIFSRRPSKPDEITRRPSQPEDTTPVRRPSKPEDTTPIWRRSSKPDEITRRPSQPEDASPTRRPSKPEDTTPIWRRPSKPDEITRRPSQPEDTSPTRRPSKPDEITRRPSGPTDSTQSRRPSSPRKSPPKEIIRRPSKESSPKRDEPRSSLKTRDSTVSFTQETTSNTRTTDKFGVTLRRTPSSGRVLPATVSAPLSPTKAVTPGRLIGIDIEEIFDLEFLEELLVKATDYDDRRRIRAQIRLVKKQLEEEINAGKKTTTTKITTTTTIPSVRDIKKPNDTSRTSSTFTTSQQHRSQTSTTTRTDSNLSDKYPASRPRSTYSPERESEPVTKPFKKESSPERRKTPSSRESPERRTSAGRTSTTTTTTTVSTRGESPERRLVGQQSQVQSRGEQSSRTVTSSNVVTNGDRTTYQATVKTQSVRRVTTSSTEVKQVTGGAAPTDSITSSYGVGPTDENGRPLFGLKALRRTNTNKTLDGETGETVTETTTEYHQQQQQHTEERRSSLQQEIQEFLLDSEGRPLFGGLKALQATNLPLVSDDMPAQTTQLRELVERHQQLVAKESSNKEQQPMQKPKAKLRDSFILQSQEEENALKGALSQVATLDDSANKGLSLKSIIKKHEGGEVRSEVESRSTVVTSHSTISSDGKVSMKKDVVRGEISAKNGEKPTGKITQSSYSYKSGSDTPSIVSTTKTTLIGGGPRRTSGPKIEEVTDGSTDQSSRRYSKEYTVEEETASSNTRKTSSGINEENVKAFTSILKNRDDSARRSSDQSDLETKRSSYTSAKSSSVTSSSTTSAFKQSEVDAPKKSLARGDSVKALQNKFQQSTASNQQQQPSRSYPKAGLILTSNSLQQADEPNTLSSSLKQNSRYSTTSTGGSDRDGSQVTSSSTRTMEDSRTVKTGDSSEQRRSSSSSTTTTTGSRNPQQPQASTFLNDSSKVTGVQDILDRMRNSDLVTEGSDSTEDAEARALLNKFLGASVILQSMEQGMRASTTSTTTSSALVSQAEKQRVKATNSNQFDDLDEITDEKQLKILLEACSDYEGRRKIRARLREVMADSKGGTLAVGSNEETADSKDGSSKSEQTFQKTEVRTRAVSSTAKLTKANSVQSPFAKFKQLERQNSAPSVARVARASSFTFTPSSASSIKERLLGWVQAQTRDYKNVQIDNFSTSWSNGLAFCALIHHFCPDAFDYSSLKPENRRNNFELAFRVAEEKSDIYPLLDVEDMVTMLKPDWKCVFTYVQSIYRRFHESPLANPTNPYLAD